MKEAMENFKVNFPLNAETYLHDGLTYNPKLIEWIKSYGQQMFLIGLDRGIKETLPGISHLITKDNK